MQAGYGAMPVTTCPYGSAAEALRNESPPHPHFGTNMLFLMERWVRRIANAVGDALGVDAGGAILDLPLSPQRVLRAVRRLREKP